MHQRAVHASQQREQKKTEMTHFRSVKDLQEHLEKSGLKDACQQVVEGVSECDPWKYEGVLLDQLILARANSRSPEAKNIRDLIWVGSVQTYERKDERAILKEVDEIRFLARHAKPIKVRAEEALPRIQSRQEISWGKDIAKSNRDPATYYEVKANATEAYEALDRVATALRQNVLGEELEPCVRLIENLQVVAWLDLKKHLAKHGLPLEEMREKEDKETITYLKEIEDLRHVRDFLYYRRLHPDWARLALNGDVKKAA